MSDSPKCATCEHDHYKRWEDGSFQFRESCPANGCECRAFVPSRVPESGTPRTKRPHDVSFFVRVLADVHSLPGVREAGHDVNLLGIAHLLNHYAERARDADERAASTRSSTPPAEPPAGGTPPEICPTCDRARFDSDASICSNPMHFPDAKQLETAGQRITERDALIAELESSLASSRSALQQAEAVVEAARVVLEAANATRRHLAGEGDQSENAGLEVDLQRVLAIKGLRAALASLDSSTGTRQ